MKLTLNALFDYTNNDGIFTYLHGQNVPWKNDIEADLLDLDYHSKYGSRVVSKHITSLLTEDGLPVSAKTKLASLLYKKNKVRWDELYESMGLYDDYNPLDNTDWEEAHSVTHSGTDSNTKNVGQKQDTFSKGAQTDSYTEGSQTFTEGQQVKTDSSQTNVIGSQTISDSAQNNTIGSTLNTAEEKKSAFNSGNNYTPNTQTTENNGARNDVIGAKTTTNGQREDTIGGITHTDGEKTNTNSQRQDSNTIGARTDTTTEGAQTITDSGANAFTESESITKHGNIGITTPGQMIRDHRKTVNWQFFDVVYADITAMLCLDVYGYDNDSFSDYKIVTPYKLPIASAQKLGGIKVGQNLSIASDGTLNAQGGGGGAVESVNGKTGEVTLDYEDVGAASASDMTTAKADIVNIKLDINQLQGSVLDLRDRTSTNESDIVNIKLNITQLQGSVLGLHNDLQAVRQVPTGGRQGQVLTKGASGYDWQDPEGVPIGTIISYMGFFAPDCYLACDGEEYDIEDYQDLADFFRSQYGSINYFGGDGETTFAVPDLQGEFLRGYGGNSHTNQGSGASIPGDHQDATTHLMTIVDGSNLNHPKGLSTTNQGQNVDSEIVSHTTTWGYRNDTQYNDGTDNPSVFTSRPTNTSVLYCIKCFV